MAYLAHEEAFLQSLESVWNSDPGNLSAKHTFDYPVWEDGSCKVKTEKMSMLEVFNRKAGGIGTDVQEGKLRPEDVIRKLEAMRDSISSHLELLQSQGPTGGNQPGMEACASGWAPDPIFDNEGSIEAALNAMVFGPDGVLAVNQEQVTQYYNSLLYYEAQEAALNSAEGALGNDPKGTGAFTCTYPVWDNATGSYTMATSTTTLGAFLSAQFGVNLVTGGSNSICLSDNMQQIQNQSNTIQNVVQNDQTFLSTSVNQVQSTCSLLQQIIASLQQLNTQMVQNIH